MTGLNFHQDGTDNIMKFDGVARSDRIVANSTGSVFNVSGTATPGITIGDGSGADAEILLRFAIDRAWQFQQSSTGASSALALKDTNGGKNFVIKNSDSTDVITFSPPVDASTSTTPNIALVSTRNSASNIYAMKITNDNSGAGKPGGIDLSAFSAAEPLLKAPSAAISNPGTLSHQLAIDIGGTIFYLYAYTTGS